jgi:hypothetical protein
VGVCEGGRGVVGGGGGVFFFGSLVGARGVRWVDRRGEFGNLSIKGRARVSSI